MAAFDTPWLNHMSVPRRQRGDTLDSSSSTSAPYSPYSHEPSYDRSSAAANVPNPTYASFSPATLSSSTLTTSAAKRRSTILVHQKSPLLLATPPQITRALAYSHPFLLPLNKVAGLLSWTTGDPWESFLVLVVFWATVLYGDVAIRFAGPVMLVLVLILGMYGRRFSPLSSSGWSEPGGADTSSGTSKAKDTVKTTAKKVPKKATSKSLSEDSTGGVGRSNTNTSAPASIGGQHAGNTSSSTSETTNTRHQKTLDEIVETLKEFTGRCNVLMEPLLELTDFLSTQRTATSATTRPALTTLFIRILLCTPFWAALSLSPIPIVTTRRVMLVFGTIFLTWHARVVKAGRTILWRSASIRRLAALMTGLEIALPVKTNQKAKETLFQKADANASTTTVGSKASTVKGKASQESELTKAIRRARGAQDAGVRFTFIIYENQRRWVGLGWTNSLFAYERSSWTDEHNNSVTARDKFELPEVEDGSQMRWRWVEGSRWRVDGVPDEAVSITSGDDGEEEAEWNYDGEGGKNGWVYYDNKWQAGRRGQDGWGRWTRRRKWYRDAELVEGDDEDEQEDAASPSEEQTPTPGSPPPPSLPPRPTAPTLAAPYMTTGESLSMPDLGDSNTKASATSNAKDIAEAESEKLDELSESASVMSTSSRSMRFRVPSLRRRVTDNTHRAANSSDHSDSQYQRSRRASEAASEDDAASLGPRVGLEIAKDRDQWGIGDEALMSLE